MITALAIAVGFATMFLAMLANEWDKASFLNKELNDLRDCHKMLLGEYDALEKQLEESEKQCNSREFFIKNWSDQAIEARKALDEANIEIAKLKAENKAFKDWQPMKDSIEKMLSVLMSPIDTQLVKLDKYSPVTCVEFEQKPGTKIKSENHELDYKYEDRG